MSETSELGDWLQEQLKRKRLSQNDLVALTNVSKGTISGIIKRGHIPKPQILREIAMALNEPVEKLYRLSGYLSPPPPERDPLEEEMLATWRQLPSWQREAFLVQARAIVESERMQELQKPQKEQEEPVERETGES